MKPHKHKIKEKHFGDYADSFEKGIPDYIKESYKEGLGERANLIYDQRLVKVLTYPKHATVEEKAYAIGIANKLLKNASKIDSDQIEFKKGGKNQIPVFWAIKAAQIHDKVEGGVRESVKKRIKKIVTNNPNQYEMYKRDIDKYLNRKIPERGEKHKGLENRIVSVIAITSLAVSLFFLSPNITGNAVGSIETSSSNIIGLIFFVLGIAGFVFFKRR